MQEVPVITYNQGSVKGRFAISKSRNHQYGRSLWLFCPVCGTYLSAYFDSLEVAVALFVGNKS